MLTRTFISTLAVMALVGCDPADTLVDPGADGADYIPTEQDVPAANVEYREPTKQQLAVGAAYMSDLFQLRPEGADRIDIDLSDDAQFQFVVDRLAMSGRTPQTAPEVFRRLEMKRIEHFHVQPGLVRTTNHLCAHVITPFAADTTGRATSMANGSCLGGSEEHFLDLAVWKASDDRRNLSYLAIDAQEEFFGGLDVEVLTNTALSSASDSSMVIQSLSQAFGATFSELTFTEVFTGAGHQVVDVMHPADINGDGPIRTCTYRGGNDCDYRNNGTTSMISQDGDEWLFGQDGNAAWIGQGPYYVALTGEGQLEFHKEIDGVAVTVPGYVPANFVPDPQSMAVLVRNSVPEDEVFEPGGFCEDADNFLDAIQIDEADRSMVSWDVLGAFAGSACAMSDNVSGGDNVKLRGRIIIPVFEKIDPNGLGIGRPQLATLGFAVDDLRFRYSCFLPGTQVLMADGSEMDVADVKVGDQLIADATGRTLTVTDLTGGIEPKSAIRIMDENGELLEMTSGHAVVLADGEVVTAGELKAGDIMMTEEGYTSIVKADTFAYSGPVYNFSLGTDDELASAGKWDTTLYANGLLVGDQNMQFELSDEHRELEFTNAARKAWAADLKTARKVRGANRR